MTSFDVNYLGMIRDVNLGPSASQSSDTQLVDRVEEAQLEGKIQLFAADDAAISFMVSRDGIKTAEVQTKDVIERHPLHTIAQVVSYADPFGKTNLILKIGQVGRRIFDCVVIQCRSEEQARCICDRISAEFGVTNDRR